MILLRACSPTQESRRLFPPTLATLGLRLRSCQTPSSPTVVSQCHIVAWTCNSRPPSVSTKHNVTQWKQWRWRLEWFVSSALAGAVPVERSLIISISSPVLQQVRFHSYLAEHSISHPAYPLYNVQYLLRVANAALPCLVNIVTVAVT